MKDRYPRAFVTRCVVVFVGIGMFFDCNALTVTAPKSSCIVDGKARRIAWLHIPKTGSSMGNMIARYLRPDLPEDAVVPDCRAETCEHVDNPNMNDVEFQYRYKYDTWFQNCIWLKGGNGPDGWDWFAHHHIDNNVQYDWDGSFVAMFREPRQRALSSWDSFADVMTPTLGGLLSKEAWARRIEGTATKMLSGQEFPIEVLFNRKRPSLVVPDVERAMSRLDSFFFVGLTEQWALSMCLFHRMTASKCNRHDIENCRRDGNRLFNETWDETELNGYVDPYDTQIYNAVSKRFWKNVKDYQLSSEGCQKICPWFDPNSFGIA